jgi:hypothetical protein
MFTQNVCNGGHILLHDQQFFKCSELRPFQPVCSFDHTDVTWGDQTVHALYNRPVKCLMTHCLQSNFQPKHVKLNKSTLTREPLTTSPELSQASGSPLHHLEGRC